MMEQKILDLFPFDHRKIDDGIKYLGYTLKPNGYSKINWAWLIEHVEHKIGLWCYRWLSLGGRLTLIKSVLEGIPIYWMTLYKIPKSILNFLKKYAASFLWSGNSLPGKIHLTKWTMIAKPRSMGGWGFKDLETFGRALRMKTMWRIFTTDSIWSQICCDKYLRDIAKDKWIMMGYKSWGNASPIWNGLLETRKWIHLGLSWDIGLGTKIRVGEVSFTGVESYIISTVGYILQTQGIYDFRPFLLSFDFYDWILAGLPLFSAGWYVEGTVGYFHCNTLPYGYYSLTKRG